MFFFKSYYKITAIDLRIQQALDADPKAIQESNVTGNLDWAGQTVMYFNIEEAKEILSIVDFFFDLLLKKQKNLWVLWIRFALI